MKVDERKMDDIPKEDRPREKLIKYGPGVLNDAELLAILLRTGVRGCNVYELARRFMEMLGSEGLMEMRAWSVDDFRGRIREYVKAVPKNAASQSEEGRGALANVAERSAIDGDTSQNMLNASVPNSKKNRGNTSLTAAGDEASVETEYRRLLSGIGDDKCATILAALEIGRRIFPKEGVPLKKPLMRPEEIAKLMFADVSRYTREGFWAIYMDRRRVPLREPFMLTLGLAQQTLIDVKTVFRNALLFNAAGIYLVHNHPSGDVRPSAADLETTRTLVRAGRMLQIPILDHVIIGRPEITPSFYSLRQEQDCEF